MLGIALQSIAYLAVPLVALALERRFRLFEVINPVVFSYIVGMVMANVPALGVDVPTAKIFTNAAVPLAIPLILFPSDFMAWLRQSRETVISFCCAVVAVCTSASVAAWLFYGTTDEFWKVAGMLVGVYTGGTPNLNSIGMALGAREETFVLVNASDVLASSFYLLFLLTIAQATLRFVLPAFSGGEGEEGEHEFGGSEEETAAVALQMSAAFGLSVVILGVSAGLSYLVVGSISVAGVFLGLTTGGILGSFVDEIRDLAGSYELGNYLILVFCVAMGARTDFGELMNAGSGILFYTAFVVYAAVLLHLLLAAIFRVDVDTFLITSTAALFGPAFVPVIAETLDNRRVVLSGLTAGLVGYAVANYLGIAMAYLVR